MRSLTLCLLTALMLAPVAALAQDQDEAELLNAFDKVDVWHVPIDYTVAYNNQDVVVAREMVAPPELAGKLCYIRFDLLRGEGEYSYGFKPPRLGDATPGIWGVYVKKIGTVLSQARSVLKMNVVYFYVDGLKKGADPDVCTKKQAAPTPQAGHNFGAGEWSDLVTRAKLVHGQPQMRPQ